MDDLGAPVQELMSELLLVPEDVLLVRFRKSLVRGRRGHEWEPDIGTAAGKFSGESAK